MRIWWVILGLVALALTGCEYEEVVREVGYKGKARLNPWLAAERFSESYADSVFSEGKWQAPLGDDAVWFVPASLLSNDSFTRQMENWVQEGGHLVVLVEHATAEENDWSSAEVTERQEPAFLRMLDRCGMVLEEKAARGGSLSADEIPFEEISYKVRATSGCSVAVKDGTPGVFASALFGDGRVSVLTDARIFRNRWIGDHQHAEFLEALIYGTDRSGNIGFIRGSELSIWGLLVQFLWPLLLGGGVVLGLWFWKNFSRFGPLDAAGGEASLRSYERHLEALGDFQWRLDKASALLAPLRAQIVERGQRMSVKSGQRDEEFFQFLANLSGIPRERVHRALVEISPADSAILTRTTADLQRLLTLLS